MPRAQLNGKGRAVGATARDSARPVGQRHLFELLETRRLLAAHILGNSTAYSTIQAAVNAAPLGAIVTVDAGTYGEQVTVNKQLTIRGAQYSVDARTRSVSASESIVDGASVNGARSAAFYITSNDVTIDGFTVQGETDASVTMGAGIVIAPNVAGTHIVNNIIQNNVSGLFLANNSASDAAVIQNNLFQNNNNNGSNGGRGIYTDGTLTGGNLTNVTIDANNFLNNRGGSGTTTLEAAMAFEAENAGEQSNIRITNNFESGNGKGFLFFNTIGVLVQGNSVTGSFDWYSGAMRFEGNNQNVTIAYNNIYANTGPGIAVDSSGVPGDSAGFVINNNNIYGNGITSGGKLGVVYNQNVYNGTFNVINNWWGSASGPGGDGPGTGDTVYGNAYKTQYWHTAPGGSETYSPWSTSQITIPTAPVLTPSAPSGLAASAVSSSQINLTWGNTATNQTGIKIERSTDNATFSLIATVGASITSYSDTGLSAGVTYYYRVRGTNSAGDSPNSAVATATTLAANSQLVYLSDLNWVSATTGYGSIQKNRSVNGNALTLNGTTYAKGIGTHAVSKIVYNLAGQYSTFISDVGVDDEVNGRGVGSVDFQVLGDGKVLFDSGVLRNGNAPVHINISVAGVGQLTLVANNGVANSIDYDHADWAGAQLLSASVAPAAPTAPSGLVATALSASSIKLAWTNTSSNQTSFAVDRSVDGTNFTTIAGAIAASATNWTDNSVLAANTKYYYRVRAVNAVGASPNSNVASTTTLPLATVTYVSDLPWTTATVGWGTIQKDKSILGNTLTLRGVTYVKGIGTHAASSITYNLAGKYTSFLSDIGIDDEEIGKGSPSVDFQILGDGKVLFDSGNLTLNSPTMSINISVAGVQNLTLVANSGVAGNIDYDHADWAGARLVT